MPDEKPAAKVEDKDNANALAVDEISEDALDNVAGGGGDINPQPLPPFRHMPM
jgi:hypothetical protein